MRIYLAAPLFTLAEQMFNKELARLIEAELSGAEVILPQERAKQLLQMPNGLELIFDDCLQMIHESDVLVAILDGADADSGTCVELGYALAGGMSATAHSYCEASADVADRPDCAGWHKNAGSLPGTGVYTAGSTWIYERIYNGEADSQGLQERQ